MANGVNVNHADGSGWTALMEAACRGRNDVLKALISRGKSNRTGIAQC